MASHVISRRSLLAFVLTGLLTLVICGCDAAPPRVGDRAPSFTLDNLNGQPISLAAEITAHRVTLVNFWATWCPPCRGEIPELVSFYQDFSSQGVQILAVDIGETPAKVQPMAAAYGMRFPILLDRQNKTADKYGVTGIPSTFILDAEGVIRKIFIGGINRATLSAEVRRVLEMHKK